MRKKFTMLLASLFLVTGTAWAYQLSYDKTLWTVPAINHEKVTEVPADVFTVYDTNYATGIADGTVAALTAEKVGVYAEDVNATGGAVTVVLNYVSGNDSNIRLDICGVDLVAADGSVVYKDYHFGWAGGNPSNETYTLTGVAEGAYTLRVFVASQKEDFTNAAYNSRGIMTVTGAKLPILGSTDENKVFYHIKNVRSGKYANYEGAGVQFTQVATPTLGSYWYLIEATDADSKAIPEGYKAYRLYNAANALAVENPSNGYMSENSGVQWPAKVYCIGEYTKGDYTGVVVRPLNEDNASWNDYGGSGTKIGTHSYDDAGSIWEFERANITESQLIQDAVAAKTAVLNTLTTEATNTERYFYGYVSSDIEAKRAEVEAISVPENSLTEALTSAIELSKMELFAGLERIAPKAGDKFTMDNHERDGRLTAFAAGTNVKCLAKSSPFAYFDAVWTLVATEEEGQFKLYNEKMNVYVGVLANENNKEFQYVSDAESAGVYELANVDGYATFKRAGGGDTDHLHLSNWSGKEIVRWDTGGPSQWQLVKAFGPELTTDADNPICYAVKSGRANNYYFTLDANKVKLFNNKSIATDETTHWYFMLDESGNLKMYSASDNKAMGYVTVENGTGKLTNDNTTENYVGDTYTLYFAPYNKTDYNGAWFALKPTSGDNYVSNNSGTGYYMGFYNQFNDAGTRIAFENVDRMRLEAKIAECEVKEVGDAIGYYSVSGGDAEALLAEAKAALQGYSVVAYRSSLAALNGLTYTLNIPETGKYYRLQNKSSNNYMSGNETAITLLADGENAASTIFYLDEDKSLRSFVSGKYLDCSAKAYSNDAKGGEFGVAYNGCEENVITYKNNGCWTYGAGNDGASLDRGSSTPNHIGYNWYIVEVDMTPVIDELNALAADATTAAALSYLTDDEKTALTTAATTMSAAATELTDGGFVKDMTAEMATLDDSIEAAMDVMIRYDLTARPFRLKQAASGLYMVASNSVKVAPKSEDVASQAFNLVATETSGVYNLKSANGLYMQVNDYSYLASAEGEAANKVHEIEYIGRGKYNIKTASGYVASDDITENSTLWSNKAKDHTNGVWEIEPLPLLDVTINYMFKGASVGEQVEVSVGEGLTYTLENPYANKYIAIDECTAEGIQPVETDGVWSVKVAEATTVTVTLVEDLPFKTSTDFATANWHYLQLNSAKWKYMQTKEADNKTTSANANSLGDRALWAFVGDALNGFKIWNKGAGEDYVLTVDAVTEETEAYMKESGEQTWTIEKGNGGFIIRQGAQECLNDYAGGSVMKIWNNTAAPTGTGSAFRTIGVGVTDLEDLRSTGIFTLQAERSPLLYDAADTTKLSSGLASGIAANAKDANLQFMFVESDTEGLYYLYSVGAAKFVDANLNFVDYPEPVLSFEPNADNDAYPWFVKIGGKYVVPDAGGTDGNKIRHLATADDNDGKRYRIEYVEEDVSLAVTVSVPIQHIESCLKDVSDLSNEKVYVVYTYDRGAWKYNKEENYALWSTREVDPDSEDNWLPGDINQNDSTQQFAFLTVGGKTYLYSVGAKKFVVRSGTATAYNETPTQPIELLPAEGNTYFPVVVAFVDGESQYHIGISNGFTPPVITDYNDLSDGGNKVNIHEAANVSEELKAHLATVVTNMETYLTAQTLLPELDELIAKAGSALDYLLDSENKAALAAAKTEAENVRGDASSTADELGEQIAALTTALNNATLVSEMDGFNNAYVYTFVSKRGWMVATEADETVKSTNEGDAINPLHQWAVYKSANNNYYLYNIGKEQFVGMTTSGNIPFAETPQMTTFTFKESESEDYPIMFSVDNVGAMNNDEEGNMIYWSDGWSDLNDEGNNHQVTIVGQIGNVLTNIETKVVFFEAAHALDAAIEALQAKADVMNELGYYSSTEENFATEFDAIKEFKAGITKETPVGDIDAQTKAANNLVATFTVFNVPQAGKFYRLKGKASNKYMSTPLSTDAANRVKMRLSDNKEDAGCFFYLTENGKLLSYKLGTFLQNTHDINAIGENNGNTVYFNKSESNNLGFFTLKTDFSGSKYIYDDASQTEVDRNGSYAANYCEWAVEEVNTLPVTVTSAGYATLYAPVALNIPGGVTAYVGVQEDNYLALTDIEEVVDGGVIPANTGVVLNAAPDTYEFTVATGEYDELEEGDNLLTGAYAKSEKNPEAKVYTLQNGANGVGFYLFKGQDTNGNTTYINGFRSWVELPNSSQANALRIRFAGTTEIEHSEFNIQNSEFIYDLQGRRVLNPTKGMYIVNGKKVLF